MALSKDVCMINTVKIISEQHHYTIDRVPIRCGECPFLIRYNYTDNAYHGIEYGCKLGFMFHGDTRDLNVNFIRWDGCKIESDSRVDILRK